jgi:PBP1b-binding outer membrane lipoprotein LpoB
MRRILTITICALMLSGCMAEWKSPRSGLRFTSGPQDTDVASDHRRTANANIASPSGQIPNP